MVPPEARCCHGPAHTQGLGGSCELGALKGQRESSPLLSGASTSRSRFAHLPEHRSEHLHNLDSKAANVGWEEAALHTTGSCDGRVPRSSFRTGPGLMEDLLKPGMEHVPGSGLKHDKTLGWKPTGCAQHWSGKVGSTGKTGQQLQGGEEGMPEPGSRSTAGLG